MIYINVFDPATGYTILQATAYTMAQAEDIAAAWREEGYIPTIYTRDPDREATVYPM